MAKFRTKDFSLWELLLVVCTTGLLFFIFINSAFPSNTIIFAIFFLLFFLLKGDIGIREHNTILLLTIGGIGLCGLVIISTAGRWDLLDGYFFENLRRFVFAIFYHVCFFFFFSKNKTVLIKAITVTLYLIVGFWWLQAILFYTTGYYLDPLKILHIREQKVAAYFLKGAYAHIDAVRPSSFFNEPGTYGSTVIFLLILDYLNTSKIKLFHVATLLSLLLALSTFSIIGCFLFLTIMVSEHFITGSVKKRLITIMVGLGVGYGCALFAINYFKLRSVTGQGFVGASIRETMLNTWQSFPVDRQLMGSGLFINDIGFPYLEDGSFIFYLLSDSDVRGVDSTNFIIVF